MASARASRLMACGGGLGDHADAGLGGGKRHLHLDVARDHRLVAETARMAGAPKASRKMPESKTVEGIGVSGTVARTNDPLVIPGLPALGLEQDRFRWNHIASNATSRLKRESCSTS